MPSRNELLEEISIRCATTEGDRLQRLVADVYAKLPSDARHNAMNKISFWLLADAAFPDQLYIPGTKRDIETDKLRLAWDYGKSVQLSLLVITFSAFAGIMTILTSLLVTKSVNLVRSRGRRRVH